MCATPVCGSRACPGNDERFCHLLQFLDVPPQTKRSNGRRRRGGTDLLLLLLAGGVCRLLPLISNSCSVLTDRRGWPRFV